MAQKKTHVADNPTSRNIAFTITAILLRLAEEQQDKFSPILQNYNNKLTDTDIKKILKQSDMAQNLGIIAIGFHRYREDDGTFHHTIYITGNESKTFPGLSQKSFIEDILKHVQRLFLDPQTEETNTFPMTVQQYLEEEEETEEENTSKNPFIKINDHIKTAQQKAQDKQKMELLPDYKKLLEKQCPSFFSKRGKGKYWRFDLHSFYADKDGLLRSLAEDFKEQIISKKKKSPTAATSIPVLTTHSLPRLTPNFEPRPEHTDIIKDQLLDSKEENIITVRGEAGMGKTTLLIALAHDPDIEAHFDSILWITLGEDKTQIYNPQIITTLKEWALHLGVSTPVGSESKTMAITITKAIRKALKEKQVLLVLDDVWKKDIADFLMLGGLHCKTLCSTRQAKRHEIW